MYKTKRNSVLVIIIILNVMFVMTFIVKKNNSVKSEVIFPDVKRSKPLAYPR